LPIFQDAAAYVRRVLGREQSISVSRVEPGAVLAERVPNVSAFAKMPRPSHLAESPENDKWPVVLGPLLTPARVAYAMRRAERGYMRYQCDLLSEMRETVPHMHSEFQKRELAIVRMPIEVMPARVTGKAERKRAARLADDVRDRLFAIENLSEGVHHLTSATFFGRAGMEQQWYRDAKGIGVKRFHTVHAKRLSYTGDGWDLHLYDEAGNFAYPNVSRFPGVPVRATWPDSFVLHEPTLLAGELLTRQGLGRVLLHMAMFWRWTVKDMMLFMELYGKPIRWGQYTKEADQEDIDILTRAVAVVGGNTAVVTPNTTEIKLVQQAHAKSPHLDSYAAFNAEISKVVVGGTLGTEVSSTGGNRALGEVHERGFDQLVQADAMAIGATLSRDFARPLVRLNYGPEVASRLCPRIVLVVDKADDMTKRTNRVVSLSDRGVAFDADEARELLTGMSKPEEGAPILVPIDVMKQGARGSADKDADGQADAPGLDATPGTADDGETEKNPKKPTAEPEPEESEYVDDPDDSSASE